MTLCWIERAPGAPYFVEDNGRSWTPIGQNDSIAWFELAGLRGRRDLVAVRKHFGWLAEHGVTCLRLMLEYAEDGQHFFEQPAGTYNPILVQLWDDLFELAESAGLRILLTPLDTYFQWVRWDQHPYNVANGGPCVARTQLMTCPATRALIKRRLAFATRRWGGSGALFAWDLWNEMHPVQGEDRPDCFADYIDDVGPFLRTLEIETHGRAHLQCVSVFGPELRWKPWLNEAIFRHPALDFASSHLYAEGTIDHPQDTVAPAFAVAELVGEALSEITDGRPFLDTEHGPIHTFKDHRVTLPEAFDDEYFRHVQWTHVACGAVGGGMRWPNRHPHALTPGMRKAQSVLARLLPLIEWREFRREPLGDRLSWTDENVAVFGCGDHRQVLLYALRTHPLVASGLIDASVRSTLEISVAGLGLCKPEVYVHDTVTGFVMPGNRLRQNGRMLTLEIVNFACECAVIIRSSS
ncbi:MAG: hypothetical protein RQ966_07150 [Acetobacteraceae bacterium]|nr:hypothetical protein [Acetobacteraceae bacterium]